MGSKKGQKLHLPQMIVLLLLLFSPREQHQKDGRVQNCGVHSSVSGMGFVPSLVHGQHLFILYRYRRCYECVPPRCSSSVADIADVLLLSALRFLDDPLRFDPCCLMSPPPPPLFPPPPQLWKRGEPVGVLTQLSGSVTATARKHELLDVVCV